MLILGRNINKTIVINDNFLVHTLDIANVDGWRQVKIGIDVPPDILVFRVDSHDPITKNEKGIFVLNMRIDQSVVINQNVFIRILDILHMSGKPMVKIGIDAPKSCPVFRMEVHERIRKEETILAAKAASINDKLIADRCKASS